MNDILLQISLITLAVSALFSLYRQFQMLQQNSYFLSRYLKWIKGSFAVGTVICALLFFACLYLYTAKKGVFLLCVCAAALVIRVVSAVLYAKKSVKPLVFTGRVRRLYLCAAAVSALLLTAFILCYNNTAGEVLAIVSLLLCGISPLFCILLREAAQPAELAFNRYYIKDAEKILKNSPRLTVIGVTGSYGKTTTKFILTRILSEKYNTVCTPGSYNTTLGVVRTVREMLPPQTQMFVCEMGAKNKGDIKEICDIVRPKYGIITSVGEQHLETFKTVDNVFNTKFELCDSVQKQGGVCLANADSAGIAARISQKPYCTAIGEGTPYYADDIRCTPAGSEFTLHLGERTLALRTKLLGRHSIADITAAAAMSCILGVGDNDIKAAVAALAPAEHRLEMKPYYNGSTVIDDAYNSNPEGCIEALNVLGSFEGMRKTVITPGLIELGDKQYEANFALGKACAANADDIILVGQKNTQAIAKAARENGFDPMRIKTVSSFAQALEIYLTYADKDSVILIENDLPDNYLN